MTHSRILLTSDSKTLNSSQFLIADSNRILTEYGNFSIKGKEREGLTDSLILQSCHVIERVLVVSDRELCENATIGIFLRAACELSHGGFTKNGCSSLSLLVVLLKGVSSEESFHSI